MPTSREHCPLCERRIDAADMSAHLRTLHQVAAGEPTIADVPSVTLDTSEGPQRIQRHEPVLSAAG